MAMDPENPGEQPGASAELDPSGNAVRAIAAATAQIDLALREAQAPVEQLGDTLGHIAEHLDDLRDRLRAHAQHCDSAHAIIEIELAVASLSCEMVKAIQHMQFYDRLFQHLSHVHDYLSGGADALASQALADGTSALDGAHRWEVLRERLFRRLLSDSQRQMLDIVLPAQHWSGNRRHAVRPAHASPGDVELF